MTINDSSSSSHSTVPLITRMEIDVVFGPDVANQSADLDEQAHVPTRDQCIEAIIRDANCSYAIADRIDQLWYALVMTWLRADPQYLEIAGFGGTYVLEAGIYVLDDRDMTSIHPTLELIAPDGIPSEHCSGSSHDLLNRRHCSGLGFGAKAGLVHSKSSEAVPRCAICIALAS